MQRGGTHSYESLRGQKHGPVKTRDVKADLLQCRNPPVRIAFFQIHPDINIGRGTNVAKMPDGITPDEQILNVVLGQQLQELSEVGR